MFVFSMVLAFGCTDGWHHVARKYVKRSGEAEIIPRCIIGPVVEGVATAAMLCYMAKLGQTDTYEDRPCLAANSHASRLSYRSRLSSFSCFLLLFMQHDLEAGRLSNSQLM